ncbi:MAG TPA: ABC transporter permease [Thermoanaerobaculia bacterium]|nr:ABC transporter permease [Thermoanaerobaculia bacterium]
MNGNRTRPRPLRRFGERSIGEEVERELEFHLEMRTEELIAEGWSPAEASAEAARIFGDRQTVAAQCRDLEVRRRRAREKADMIDALRQDLRFAIRQLLSHPGFTVAALLTLALGIGATSAIFSLVDGVLLRPLPWPDPGRVVDVAEINERGRPNAVSTPNYEDWRRSSTTLEAMSVWSGWTDTVTVGDEAWNVPQSVVSGEFLEVFGVTPQIGRDFVAEELVPGGDPAALVSDRFYRRHLDSERPLEEQTVQLGGKTFRVVGVTPPGFEFPEGAELWTPRELRVDNSGRTAHNWQVVARLAPGATVASVQTEMSHIAATLLEEHAGDNDAYDARVTPIKEVLVGPSRAPLLMLLGAAFLVLLVSASNIAGALLARALGRRTELGIRSALGAGRGRVVRQLLTETSVLTFTGGMIGLLLAHLAIRLVRAIEPGRLPRLDEVAIDGRVLLFTLSVSLLTGIVFGLAPALFAARTELRDVLAEGGRSGAGGRRTPAWSLLVGAEVALAMVLLVGAGLLLKGLWTLLRVDPGFRTSEVLTLDVTVPNVDPPEEYDAQVYREHERAVGAFLERFETALSAAPGVERVALTSSLPFAGFDVNGTVCLQATDSCFDSDDPSVRGYGSYRVVTGSYFAVLDIPLLAGRVFDSRDHAAAPHVVVVSEQFARETWPDQDPLGRIVRPVGLDLHDEVPATVIGVVADVRHRGLDASPRGTFYLSLRQRPWRARWSTALFEGASGIDQIAGAIRAKLRTEFPRLPIELVPMEQHRLDSVAEERFTSTVLGAFAALALTLAAIGIWCVVSYQVAQRTRELGIRIALGAAPRWVLRMVVVDVMRIVGIGGAIGIAAALGLSRLLESQLYGVSSRDPATFVAVMILVVGASIAASLAPATRAARIDPIVAMTET